MKMLLTLVAKYADIENITLVKTTIIEEPRNSKNRVSHFKYCQRKGRTISTCWNMFDFVFNTVPVGTLWAQRWPSAFPYMYGLEFIFYIRPAVQNVFVIAQGHGVGHASPIEAGAVILLSRGEFGRKKNKICYQRGCVWTFCYMPNL